MRTRRERQIVRPTIDILGVGRNLPHHHPPYRLRRERHRQLPSPIRLHLEFVVVAHHIEEPLVRLSGREKAVGGRQSERDFGGWAA